MARFDVDPRRWRENTGNPELREAIGERTVTCFRCGIQVRESRAVALPRGAVAGNPRILVCGVCAGIEEETDA